MGEFIQKAASTSAYAYSWRYRVPCTSSQRTCTFFVSNHVVVHHCIARVLTNRPLVFAGFATSVRSTTQKQILRLML